MSVTMVFFGDGATNQGTFHETLNLASVWQLPIIFLHGKQSIWYGIGGWESPSARVRFQRCAGRLRYGRR